MKFRITAADVTCYFGATFYTTLLNSKQSESFLVDFFLAVRAMKTSVTAKRLSIEKGGLLDHFSPFIYKHKCGFFMFNSLPGKKLTSGFPWDKCVTRVSPKVKRKFIPH